MDLARADARSTAGDNIEILYPICGTAWVPERPYVFHDPTAWWGVQETASADLLGFVLLDTSLFVRLRRGAAHLMCDRLLQFLNPGANFGRISLAACGG